MTIAAFLRRASRSGLKVLAILVILAGAAPARSQGEPGKQEPLQTELRGLFEAISAAYNAGDLDRFISYFDDRCVVTWQNAAVKEGAKQVKDYLKETTQDRFRFIDKSTIDLLSDGFALETQGSQVAVVHGRSLDHYELAEGAKYDQWTTWTATVMKKDGRWKVVSLHLSTNMFDNPVVAMVYKRTAWWTGGIVGVVALLLGLSAGWWLGWWRRGRVAPANANASVRQELATHPRGGAT